MERGKLNKSATKFCIWVYYKSLMPCDNVTDPSVAFIALSNVTEM